MNDIFKTIDQDLRLIRALEKAIDWSKATFPNATPEGRAKHLVKEAGELVANPGDKLEIADCLILIAVIADQQNIDLADALESKLAILINRSWSEPDADGIQEHLKIDHLPEDGRPGNT